MPSGLHIMRVDGKTSLHKQEKDLKGMFEWEKRVMQQESPPFSYRKNIFFAKPLSQRTKRSLMFTMSLRWRAIDGDVVL